MENKLGQEPAFPFFETNASGYGNTVVVDTPTGRLYLPFQSGMSRRFYAACAAMQGILASVGGTPLLVTEKVIKLSYEMADELLAQENN